MTKFPPPKKKYTLSGTKSEQLQSKVISFLRFPLCAAVVMIHIVANTDSCANTPIYDSVHYLFGDIFARVAVPLFFMFSGYLFFYKSEKFALDDYKRKLQKRINPKSFNPLS